MHNSLDYYAKRCRIVEGVRGNMNKSIYFSSAEFKCQCGKCGEHKMSQEFLDKLDTARSISKTPYKITSGYRCKAHNKAVGGHENSLHVQGTAVDILADTDRKRSVILIGLIGAGFTHIGIASNFIHVDLSKKVGCWLYK